MDKAPCQILIVDDEASVRWGLQQSLIRDGHEVMTTSNGAEGLAAARRHSFDLVILDINMPGKDGFWVCRQLRSNDAFSAIPIMFLTSRSEVADRVKGLDHGGDDYLAKPFHLAEFNARVRALLRRRGREPAEAAESKHQRSALEAGPIVLDIETREARLESVTVKLTPREYDLLHHFMLHVGEVFSSQELLQQVWGYPGGSNCSSLVRWHMKSLRAKIEPTPDSPIYLRTVPHHGYVLQLPAPLSPDTAE